MQITMQQVLFDELEARILAGYYKDKLPSTREMMAEFECSNTPLCRAIEVLKARGYVYSEPKGIYVKEEYRGQD